MRVQTVYSLLLIDISVYPNYNTFVAVGSNGAIT